MKRIDWGLLLAIVGIVLCALFLIGGIVYQIHKVNMTCYNISFVYNDNTIVNYHCDYYYSYDDHYELYFHDGSKMIIFKSNLDNIIIDEVVDYNA